MAALGAELTLVPSEGGRTTKKLVLEMIETARGAFVHCVGTAASSRGVATVLKRYSIRIVVVEPAESSVLLGGQPQPHEIEGVGIGYTPPLWDPTLVDVIVRDRGRRNGVNASLKCRRRLPMVPSRAEAAAG